MGEVIEVLRRVLLNILEYCQRGSGITLRSYQEEVAQQVVRSVTKGLGLSLVVVFPRQSGKNELQAQIESYLLALYWGLNIEMVKVSPTWKPQSLNAMRRLERVLTRNVIAQDLGWRKEQGYIYNMGGSRIYFLSGSRDASVVGATATHLLECDEAQDIGMAKWDKDFAPMAASRNATRVFWGTMWTSHTLLARELRAARELEKQDGIRRAWVLSAEEVRQEVPKYGEYVDGQAAMLGRNHPMVKSQFYSEEIDAEGGMFPERRLALMRGEHSRQHSALRNRIYAMLVDVGGEDEGTSEQYTVGQWASRSGDSEPLANPRRDSTALTVVEVDLAELATLRAPVYRAVDRRTWVGVEYATLHGQLVSLAEAWRARVLVIDATGVGAGLASSLQRALGRTSSSGRTSSTRVIPYRFNVSTKSKLGWGFLSVIETGRYKEARVESRESGDVYDSRFSDLASLFLRQCRACQMEILPGPERRMKWGVPNGMRDPDTGDYLHDDLVLSAALCAALDECSANEWAVSGAPVIIKRQDPLAEMDEEGF